MQFQFTPNTRSLVNSPADVARAVESFSDPSVTGYTSSNTAEMKANVDRMNNYLQSGERLSGNVPYDERKGWNMNSVPLQRAHQVLTQKPRQYQSFEINARFLGPLLSLKRGDFIVKINAPKHPTNSINDTDNIDWENASKGKGNFLKHNRKFSTKCNDAIYVLNIAQLNWFLAHHDVAKMFGFSKLGGKDIYSPHQLQQVIVPLGVIESIEMETASPAAMYEHQLSGEPCGLTDWNTTFYARVKFALRNVDNLANSWPNAGVGDELYLRFYNCVLKKKTDYSFEVAKTESTSGRVSVKYDADTVCFQVEDLVDYTIEPKHYVDPISKLDNGKCCILHVGTLFSFINKTNRRGFKKRKRELDNTRDITHSTRQSSHDAIKGYITASWCK